MKKSAATVHIGGGGLTACGRKGRSSILPIIWILFALTSATSLHSEESHFKSTTVDLGVSIDIPRHWQVHSEVDKKNIAAAGESIAGKGPNKIRLLAVSAMPAPTGAKIRVNKYSPCLFSQEDIDSMGPDQLAIVGKAITVEMTSAFNKMGARLVGDVVAEKVIMAGRNGIAFNYRRTDDGGLETWRVKMVRIHHGGDTIEYTQSYRDGQQATMWSAILEHCMQSLTVSSQNKGVRGGPN